jgi:hypothetical protein
MRLNKDRDYVRKLNILVQRALSLYYNHDPRKNLLEGEASVELWKNRESHSSNRHVRGQPRLIEYSYLDPDPDF